MGYQYWSAFCSSLKEFCRHTSCNGFVYITHPKKTWLERCLWCVVQLILVGCTVLMMLHFGEDILENSLVVSLESSSFPINKVTFPAVAICNINQISKKKAEEYANYLSKKKNLTFNLIFEQIRVLGQLYDYNVDGHYNYLEIQSAIENNHDENRIGNMYYLMRNLTTPCDELLYKCIWKGQVRNCSDIFEQRPTYAGFCCIFNYLVPKPSTITTMSKRKPETLELAGGQYGLTVTVRNEPADYLYPVMDSIGVNVQIFNPYDYPDANSGSLIQLLCPVDTESFVSLEPHTIHSVRDIRRYPVKTRKCKFDDEESTLFGKCSTSNCLMECRIKSMLALCQCVPFVVPLDVVECTLPDLPCMAKYQDKWQNLYPFHDETEELERERQIGLVCKTCYPTCTDTVYRASTNFAPLNLRDPSQDISENFSVIRIYYGNDNSKLYKHDVVSYWFEILSGYGGILGIFLGGSILSIIEFIYFVTFRFIFILQKSKV